MKLCSRCKENKSKTLFSKDKTRKDGFYPICKDCHGCWKINNPTYNKDWRARNPDYYKDRYLANPEKHKEQGKVYRLANPEKKPNLEAKRRAKKIQATPLWADFEKDATQELYRIAQSKTKETGIKHHVDHIVPLNSKLVQGLHCLANLQILEAKDNIAKGNRIWPDMP